MKSIAYIYGIRRKNTDEDQRSVSGIKYVGATTRPLSTRLGEHFYASKTGRLPLHKWMRKYPREQIEIVLLESCPKSEVASREYYWILKLDTYVHNKSGGLNCTLGGEGFTEWNVNQASTRKNLDPSKTRSRKSKIDNTGQNYIAKSHSNGTKSAQELASMYGVSTVTIYNVLKQKGLNTKTSYQASEKYIAKTGENNSNAKLSEVSVLSIRKRYSTGSSTVKELASMYGVSRCTIENIIKRRTWKHV